MLDVSTMADAVVIAIVAVDRAFSHRKVKQVRTSGDNIAKKLDAISERILKCEQWQQRTQNSIESIFRILANVMQKKASRPVRHDD